MEATLWTLKVHQSATFHCVMTHEDFLAHFANLQHLRLEVKDHRNTSKALFLHANYLDMEGHLDRTCEALHVEPNSSPVQDMCSYRHHGTSSHCQQQPGSGKLPHPGANTPPAQYPALHEENPSFLLQHGGFSWTFVSCLSLTMAG
mmetsp:Transcript_61717/g.135196  ORF Transcript_61717/g.135196 Transcript_61717/m.135196 type:complete len:146 (-) Transcript_61717:497-934(-)